MKANNISPNHNIICAHQMAAADDIFHSNIFVQSKYNNLCYYLQPEYTIHLRIRFNVVTVSVVYQTKHSLQTHFKCLSNAFFFFRSTAMSHALKHLCAIFDPIHVKNLKIRHRLKMRFKPLAQCHPIRLLNIHFLLCFHVCWLSSTEPSSESFFFRLFASFDHFHAHT